MRLLSRAPAVVLVASLGALATVFAMQYGWGIAPCPLCVYQRYPYVAAGLLALVALVVGEGAWRRRLMAATALVFTGGAGLAVYHVGVEQHWWTSAVCETGLGAAQTLEELRAQILATPVVPCDVVSWSLFGISLAGYNAMASLPLALLAGAAAMRRPTGRQG